MSATSKRDRALAEGTEPATGKEHFQPAKDKESEGDSQPAAKKAKKKASKKEGTSNG